MIVVLVAERVGPGLTDAERDRLATEHAVRYGRYGLSMRPVVTDWSAFAAYWERACAEVLTDTPAARAVLDLRELDRPPTLGWLPMTLWRVA
jgi:uncharacterized protein (DUF2236 family)